MNSSLSEIEQDAFVEIINIGLSKAADALSLMIKQRVLIRCIDIMSPIEVFNEMGNDLIKLVTNLRGDVEGSCYFIVSESDAQYLTNKAFGTDNVSEKFLLTERNEGFLLELDNIISAAVITQLSDLLEVNTFGDVPRIDLGISQQEIDRMLHEYTPLFFKTQFRTDNATFNPGFYWFLKPKVISQLKKMVHDGGYHKKIKA